MEAPGPLVQADHLSIGTKVDAKGGVRTFGHDLELPHCVVKAATKCRYLESWDYMVIRDSVA
ncbi:hypothetical protein MCELHM10_04111 [Paracoccaceae bacterium]